MWTNFLLVVLFSTSVHGTAQPWPAQSTASVSPNQKLALLDANLRLEMSGAFWNNDTQVLWATAGGQSGYGTFALAYNSSGDSFYVLETWPGDIIRDEDITMVNLGPILPNTYQIFILNETYATIYEFLMTIESSGPGSNQLQWAT